MTREKKKTTPINKVKMPEPPGELCLKADRALRTKFPMLHKKIAGLINGRSTFHIDMIKLYARNRGIKFMDIKPLVFDFLGIERR